MEPHNAVSVDFLFILFRFLFLSCHVALLVSNALPFGEGAPEGGGRGAPQGQLLHSFHNGHIDCTRYTVQIF